MSNELSPCSKKIGAKYIFQNTECQTQNIVSSFLFCVDYRHFMEVHNLHSNYASYQTPIIGGVIYSIESKPFFLSFSAHSRLNQVIKFMIEMPHVPFLLHRKEII